MLSLPHGRVLLILGWLLVAATVAGSLASNLPHVGVGGGDKMLHFLVYFALTLWFAGLYPLRRLWIIAVAFVLLGGMLEVLQGTFTRHREVDSLDFLANSIGVASACLLALVGLSRWAIRLEAWLTRRRAVGQE
jgi:VanZ family protein